MQSATNEHYKVYLSIITLCNYRVKQYVIFEFNNLLHSLQRLPLRLQKQRFKTYIFLEKTFFLNLF